MLDILSSPLRGYIAQNLQYYLSKYIEGIQLEGLGLFGGDFVLNDLEIKRHVLVESLEIPSSFDFSRGFIRDLRIHIPWTQLLSQPIEVKLYTIELILTARDPTKPQSASLSTVGDSTPPKLKRRTSRSLSADVTKDGVEIDHPKSGWLRETLQKILINVRIQINNLVLKYEQEDMVLSIALGSLDCYSVCENDGWIRSFLEPQGPKQMIYRSIDIKDLTIFLDRYTSDRKQSDPTSCGIHRRVVGYEVPVLSRTSVSLRVKGMLKPGAGNKDEHTSQDKTDNHPREFPYHPSIGCDPFYFYSRERQHIKPMLEVDAFISDLSFSLSDRQLVMLSTLIHSSPMADVVPSQDSRDTTEIISQKNAHNSASSHTGSVLPISSLDIVLEESESRDEKKSWLGWAMNVLGGPENEEDDELVSEILAESKEALERQSKVVSTSLLEQGSAEKTIIFPSCYRIYLSSTSLTLRKHEGNKNQEETVENFFEDDTVQEDDELIPVANMGYVRVRSSRKSTSKITRPAIPCYSLTLRNIAMESVLIRGDTHLTDAVFEIERVEILPLDHNGVKRREPPLVRWGDEEMASFRDCVTHPYFSTTFFIDEIKKHGRKSSRSLDLVRVSLDQAIPVWKKVEPLALERNSATILCDCTIFRGGKRVPCVPLSSLQNAVSQIVSAIGIKERQLNEKLLATVVTECWMAEVHYPLDLEEIVNDLGQLVRDYHALRDPDMSADKNLEQRLCPQLMRLFIRLTFHSCLYINTTSHVDIRARSVHSAIRLRYTAKTDQLSADTSGQPSESTEEPNLRYNVLDISFGNLDLYLEPTNSSDVVNLLSILGKADRTTEERDEQSTVEDIEEPLVVASMKLITFHSITIRIPESLSSTKDITVVICRQFHWWTKHYEGASNRELAATTVRAEIIRAPSKLETVIEIQGFNWKSSSSMKSTKDPTSSETKLSTTKVFLNLGFASIIKILVSIDSILELLGVSQFEYLPGAWCEQTRLDCIELCNCRMTFLSSTKNQRNSMCVTSATELDVESIAMYSTRGSIIRTTFCSEFNLSKARNRFISFRSTRESSIELSISEHASYVYSVHVASFDGVLKDIIRVVNETTQFIGCIILRRSNNTDKEVEGPRHIKASQWKAVVSVNIEGGNVMLTQAIKLIIPSISISVTPDADIATHHLLGCSLQSSWQVGDVLLVNIWSVDGNEISMHVHGWSGGFKYRHDLPNTADDVEVHHLDFNSRIVSTKFCITRFLVTHMLRMSSYLRRPQDRIKGKNSPANQPLQVNTKPIWSVRCGLQLERLEALAKGNIDRVQPNGCLRYFPVATELRVREFGLALRIGNHHPTIPSKSINLINEQTFIDVQLYCVGVETLERRYKAAPRNRHRFGKFAVLSDRTFLRILLCLGADELRMIAFVWNCPSLVSGVNLSSPITAWQVGNRMTRLFQNVSCNSLYAPTNLDIDLPTFEGVKSFNEFNSVPILSIYYRNYGDTSDTKQIVAVSLESSDIVLSPASWLVVASLLSVQNPKHSVQAQQSNTTLKVEIEHPVTPTVANHSSQLDDLRISVVVGKVRVFMPKQNWEDVVGTSCPCIMMESASVMTSSWTEISVEGLGYPPFHTTMLPRQSHMAVQRFGDPSQVRMGCRVTNICAATVLWSAPKGQSQDHPVVRRYSIENADMVDVFFGPFSIAMDREQEHVDRSGMISTQIKSSITITKIRLELQKSTFDDLMARNLAILSAIESINSALRTWNREQVKGILEDTPVTESPSNQVVLFSGLCDGADLVLVNKNISLHCRVGTMEMNQVVCSGSGSFSVQNLVLSYRYHKMQASGTISEELVFGPQGNPALWQVVPDNYPEKLMSGRWTVPTQKDNLEASLFVDLQGSQLHVSMLFLDAVIQYVQPPVDESVRYQVYIGTTNSPPKYSAVRRDRYAKGRKWVVKSLLGKSVISFQADESDSLGFDSSRTAVWITIGQVFANVGIGADGSRVVAGIDASSRHPLMRYVSVPAVDFMFTLECLGIHTSDQTPILAVRYRNDVLNTAPSCIESSWRVFTRVMNANTTPTSLLHDCTIRVTGERFAVLERAGQDHGSTALFATTLSSTVIQIDACALPFKLSSQSLKCINELIDQLSVRHARSSNPVTPQGGRVKEVKTIVVVDEDEYASSDDFGGLSRSSDSRHPAPGELVYAENLLIETASNTSSGEDFPSNLALRVMFNREEVEGDIDQEADVLAWIDIVNRPLLAEPLEFVDGTPSMSKDHQTNSWMCMKWCYHLPRKILDIEVHPVPIPPNGIPSQWPIWQWNGSDDSKSRPCDIICQLRAWDPSKRSFVLIGEFLVPWEAPQKVGCSPKSTSSTGSFGDLVNMWLDDDESAEQVKHMRVLKLTTAVRIYSVVSGISSDKWELRWRSTLSAEKDQQLRLHVSALLSASLKIRSQLDISAYKQLYVHISVPRVAIAIAFANGVKLSLDVMSVEFHDCTLLVSSGAGRQAVTHIAFQSLMQVQMENFVQLLTMAVIPRLPIDGSIELSGQGTTLSVVLGDADIFLSQTAIIMLSCINDLLSWKRPSRVRSIHEELPGIRITIVNRCGCDVSYRQFETPECLFLHDGSTHTYSWLNVVGTPCQLQFAPHTATNQLFWCDPCPIKSNGVTGRYIKVMGFLWICVELVGMETIVTIRAGVNVRNLTDYTVHLHDCTTKNQWELVPHYKEIDESHCTGVSILCDSVDDLEICVDKDDEKHLLNVHDLPAEFDILQESSMSLNVYRKLIDTKSGSMYIVAKRAECDTVMPNDFDLMQPKVARRYTWLEITLVPALLVRNRTDKTLWIGLETKDGNHVSISVGARRIVKTMRLNPLFITKLSVIESDVDIPHLEKTWYDIQLPQSLETKESVYTLTNWLAISTATIHGAEIIIQKQMNIVNTSLQSVTVQLCSSIDNIVQTVHVKAEEERPCELCVTTNDSIEVKICVNEGKEDPAWSSGVILSTRLDQDTKQCHISTRSQLGMLFVLTMMKGSGTMKLMIASQVQVYNDTGYILNIMPGDAISETTRESEPIVLVDKSAWSPPVFALDQSKRPRLSSGLTTWLSSAFNRQHAQSPSSSSSFNMVCTIRISIDSAEYGWSDEINIKIPNTVDQSIKRTTSPYASPSSVTRRYRELIRHNGLKHVMLTYTISQVKNTIHILLFVDKQPRVVIENLWRYPIAFRRIIPNSIPDAVGSHHCLEYDWNLQVDRQTPHQTLSPVHPTDIELVKWLDLIDQVNVENSETTMEETLRFQLGIPAYGWSNPLWQVAGIQFAKFFTENSTPTFLVAITFRAGTWHISISCLDEPVVSTALQPHHNTCEAPPVLAKSRPKHFRVAIGSDELRIHICDENEPQCDSSSRQRAVYPELFQLLARSPTFAFISSPIAPAMTRAQEKLGYLEHIRAYNTLFVGLERLELDHFVKSCNFPVVLSVAPVGSALEMCFPLDVTSKHDELMKLIDECNENRIPREERLCLAARVISVDTWDHYRVSSYFQNIEIKVAPAIVQIEEDLLLYIHAFTRPIGDAMKGLESKEAKVTTTTNEIGYLEHIRVTSQTRLYVDCLVISDLNCTITARMSIPILNSLDGTSLRFDTKVKRHVFEYPDQLYKDLAADYVADIIVRSPLLLMSLNILGNPVGFFRNLGSGVRGLFEIPMAAASRDGLNPWHLMKGILGGVASLVGHTSAAALSSISGFSYSISRTVDQLTLTPEQLRKRHYVKPKQLTSALTSGLESLGFSVVGAATGMVSTPVALYQEKRQKGLRPGVTDVVGGFGMGLVGVFARPMGGVASLLAMASDGILQSTGIGENALVDPSEAGFVFAAKPNELLRVKLKVLCDPSVGDLVIARGVWIRPTASLLEPTITIQGMHVLISTDREDERLAPLFSSEDENHIAVAVTVVASRQSFYVVGECGDKHQVILSHTPLSSIQAIEESLKEPSRLELGVHLGNNVDWYHLRLFQSQRRDFSHQLRTWMAEFKG